MPVVAWELCQDGPGWWLFFREEGYHYPTAYYVPEQGEYVRSDPSKAPPDTSWSATLFARNASEQRAYEHLVGDQA